MWNRISRSISLLVILLSFQVLSKGRQSSQSTTMLRNECTHTFLYVFGHCGEYMLSLLLILISKSWRGVSPAPLSAGAVCVCLPFLVYLLPYLLARLLQIHPVRISLPLVYTKHSLWCDHRKWVKLIQIYFHGQPHPGPHQ